MVIAILMKAKSSAFTLTLTDPFGFIKTDGAVKHEELPNIDIAMLT